MFVLVEDFSSPQLDEEPGATKVPVSGFTNRCIGIEPRQMIECVRKMVNERRSQHRFLQDNAFAVLDDRSARDHTVLLYSIAVKFHDSEEDAESYYKASQDRQYEEFGDKYHYTSQADMETFFRPVRTPFQHPLTIINHAEFAEVDELLHDRGEWNDDVFTPISVLGFRDDKALKEDTHSIFKSSASA